MSTTKRTRRVHITPDDLRVGGLRWVDNKFTFTFVEYRGAKGDLEVIIALDLWWSEYLAEHIHLALGQLRQSLLHCNVFRHRVSSRSTDVVQADVRA